MTDKDIQRCTGCGNWVYGITLCGMCVLAARQQEKQKEFQECKHEKIFLVFGIRPKVVCNKCRISSEVDESKTDLQDPEKLRQLLKENGK